MARFINRDEVHKPRVAISNISAAVAECGWGYPVKNSKVDMGRRCRGSKHGGTVHIPSSASFLYGIPVLAKNGQICIFQRTFSDTLKLFETSLGRSLCAPVFGKVGIGFQLNFQFSISDSVSVGKSSKHPIETLSEIEKIGKPWVGRKFN